MGAGGLRGHKRGEADLDEEEEDDESHLAERRGFSAPTVDAQGKRLPVDPRGPFSTPKASNAAAYSSVLSIFLKLTQTARQDTFFVVVYARWSTDSTWVCLYTSDHRDMMEDTLDFQHPVRVSFSLEKPRMLRFEVYAARSEKLEDLRTHKFIGGANTSLIDAIMARRDGTSWLVLDLIHPRKFGTQAKLGAFAEEDSIAKQSISFELCSEALNKTDRWKSIPDPYVKVRVPSSGSQHFQTIYRTEVQRKMKKGSWARVEIMSTQLWPRGESKNDVLLEVIDWFRMSEHRSIGETYLSYDDLAKAFHSGTKLTLGVYRKPGKNKHIPPRNCRQVFRFGVWHDTEEAPTALKKVGIIHIKEINMGRMYSVLDYLRGGLELKLAFGVDLTRSGGEGDLHKLDLNKTNSYVGVIKALGEMMKVYDADNMYPAYGLGARLPPTWSIPCDAFALSGDFLHPELMGVEGIIDAYRRSLKIAKLHGPTRLSSLVDLAVQMSASYNEVQNPKVEMAFHVFLILTDGGIYGDDKKLFIQRLAAAAEVPLEVVIICVGAGDFSYFRDLKAKVAEYRRLEMNATDDDIALRDVVHCVELPTDRMADSETVRIVAQKGLEHIPQEVMGFYKGRDCKPRNLSKFEEDNGRPKPRPEALEAREKRKPTRQNSRASSRSTAKTGDRSVTRDSDISRTSSRDESAAAHKDLNKLPDFLQQRKDDLVKSAMALGYDRRNIERALRDGCAADSVDLLVDTIIHCGYGRSPSYKECLNQVGEDVAKSMGLNISRDTAVRLLQGVKEQVHCDRVSLFVFDRDLNVLRLFAANLDVPITMSPGQGLAGYVLANGETLNIPDCYRDHRFEQAVDLTTGYTTRSMLAVPLHDQKNDYTVGILQIINKLPTLLEAKGDNYKMAVPFPPQDVELANIYASGLGDCLSKGELGEEEVSSLLLRGQRQADVVQANRARIDDRAVRDFVFKAAQVMRCDRFLAYVRDQVSGELVMHGSHLADAQRYELDRLSPMVQAVFKDQEFLTIDDAYADTRFDFQSQDKKSSYRTKSILASPIVDVRGISLGFIQAINKLPANVKGGTRMSCNMATSFNGRDENVMAQFADLLAEPVEQCTWDMDETHRILKMIGQKHRTRVSQAVLDAQVPSCSNSRSNSRTASRQSGGLHASSSPVPSTPPPRTLAHAASLPSLPAGSPMPMRAPSPSPPRSMDDVAPPVQSALATLLVQETPKGKEKPRRSSGPWDFCRVCMQSPVQMEQVPCGHKLLCSACAGEPGSTCLACSAFINSFKPIRSEAAHPEARKSALVRRSSGGSLSSGRSLASLRSQVSSSGRSDDDCDALGAGKALLQETVSANPAKLLRRSVGSLASTAARTSSVLSSSASSPRLSRLPTP
eukprot:TRINITY_DN17963_c0_g2_i1.p1 TRINITY_DN17963_c0_g2~~TRINITY_DN17963_c0_g2_i1.p1  ORF type:complete len:1417 (+),score=300.73 TRINITY_DN17963_c0_g2_i1:103-4251(+)